MPATSVNWPGTIPATDYDTNSPLTTTYGGLVADSLVNLREALADPASYDENVKNHDHDGSNSAKVSVNRGANIGFFLWHERNVAAEKVVEQLDFTPQFTLLTGPNTGQDWYLRTTGMATGDSYDLFDDVLLANVALVNERESAIVVRDDYIGVINEVAVAMCFKAYSGVILAGTYVGDGGASQVVSFGGGMPEALLVVREDSAAVPAIRSKNHTGSNSMGTDGNNKTTHITALGSSSFTVGAGLNVNLATYRFFGFYNGGTTDEKVFVKHYTGNGAATQDIAGVGFKPDLVIVVRTDGTGQNVAGKMAHGQDNTGFDISGGVQDVDTVKLLQSDGFRVGPSNKVNANLVPYTALCFRGTWRWA